jgi:hypothetical protein
MRDLRIALLKLAHEQPELRKYLIPLLREGARELRKKEETLQAKQANTEIDPSMGTVTVGNPTTGPYQVWSTAGPPKAMQTLKQIMLKDQQELAALPSAKAIGHLTADVRLLTGWTLRWKQQWVQ